MKIKKFTNLLAISVSIFCSSIAVAGGGGDGGGDANFPAPDDCVNNCGYETGPTPNLSFVRAESGPQTVTTTQVDDSVDGFAGGVIYYPSSLSEPMATIAVAAGFNNQGSRVSWWGEILASHGFVVFIIDTNSRFDNPESRSRQLDSALSYLLEQNGNSASPIAGLVDETRLATMGYSMGGGGALHSVARNNLSAALVFSPYNTGSNNYNSINEPTMIMGCRGDGTAPVNTHAIPFYNRIPASTDKAYLEFASDIHGCATGDNSSDTALLSTYGVSWMKRFLDKDRRYNQFLCGPDHTAEAGISDYRDGACNS